MRYFLGLDSGGTQTECWLGDAERVLARASCGSIKLTRVGEEVAGARLHALLAEVADAAGVLLAEITAATAGMSGYSIPRLREWMRQELSSRVAGHVEVCGDEQIALDAAFQGGPGILLIAGTGSIAVGRCADGTSFTAGGWGPALGDEGSGAWIGAEGLRAGFRALDRGVDTALVESVRQLWGAADQGEVVGLAHTQPPPDFAALAPVVTRLAAAGDAVARDVLVRGGQLLAELVRTVAYKMRGHGEGEVSVACTGSILIKVALVRDALREALGPDAAVLPEAILPVAGALWRAQQVP